MEVRAYLKGARLSPQKAGLVADQVRGLEVEQALDEIAEERAWASEASALTLWRTKLKRVLLRFKRF